MAAANSVDDTPGGSFIWRTFAYVLGCGCDRVPRVLGSPLRLPPHSSLRATGKRASLVRGGNAPASSSSHAIAFFPFLLIDVLFRGIHAQPRGCHGRGSASAIEWAAAAQWLRIP